MKKVVLFFGIAAAVALASCGNKPANQEPAVIDEVEEVVTIDSIALDDEDGATEIIVIEEEVAE